MKRFSDVMRRVGHQLAAAEQAGLAAAHDPPIGHVRAGDVAGPPGLDHHPHLGVALDLLDQLRASSRPDSA